jgi:hypothetical protein
MLNFGTRWRRFVNSTSRPLYSWEIKNALPIKQEAGKVVANKNIKWYNITVQTINDLQNFKLRSFGLKQLYERIFKN